MVAFARARSRSWLSRLWPVKLQTKSNEIDKFDTPKELIKIQHEQNKCFLETSKNGGMWFS